MFRLCYLLAVACLVATTVRLPVLGISVSDGFLLAALCTLAWKSVTHRGRHGWGVPRHALWFPATFVLVGGLVSSIRAVAPTTSVSISLKVWFVLTVWVSMTMVMVRRGHLSAILKTFVAAVTFASAVGIHDSLTGEDWGAAISGRTEQFWGRIDGTTGHPNELGYLTSVAIPLTLGALFANRQHRGRSRTTTALMMALGVNAWALLLAGSVAGWLSTAVSTAVITAVGVWYVSQRASAALAWATSVAGLIVVVVVAGAHGRATRLEDVNVLVKGNLERVSSTTGPGRWRLLEEARDRLIESPWIGAGMDQTGTGGLAQEQLVTEERIHNTIVSGWLAGGILAFVGLVWSYLVVLLAALNGLIAGVRRKNWIAIGLGACVFGWLLFDQTQPNLYHRFTWMTVGLLFGLGLQVGWSPRRVSPHDATVAS